MNRYTTAKIWVKFLIKLWFVKLSKEPKNPYPCFDSIGRTQREDRKNFCSSYIVVWNLRDPGSVPIREVNGHSSTKRKKKRFNTSLMFLSLSFQLSVV